MANPEYYFLRICAFVLCLSTVASIHAEKKLSQADEDQQEGAKLVLPSDVKEYIAEQATPKGKLDLGIDFQEVTPKIARQEQLKLSMDKAHVDLTPAKGNLNQSATDHPNGKKSTLPKSAQQDTAILDAVQLGEDVTNSRRAEEVAPNLARPTTVESITNISHATKVVRVLEQDLADRRKSTTRNNSTQILVLGFIAGFGVLLLGAGAYFVIARGWKPEQEQANSFLIKKKQNHSVAFDSGSERASILSKKSGQSGQIPSSTSEGFTSMSDTGSSGQDSFLSAMLCPLLVVPSGTRLACVVQRDCKPWRQTLSFNIRALECSGGVPLFQIRVSELNEQEVPGIHVETLRGQKTMASLFTERLWRESRGTGPPDLPISGPDGPFANLQKSPQGDYRLISTEGRLLMAFGGDFQNHRISVVNAAGAVVARVSKNVSKEYHVYVQARADAGVVILGLLGIDKCEQDEADSFSTDETMSQSTDRTMPTT